MKLISTPQQLTQISAGTFFGGLQNTIFSIVGAGIGAAYLKPMVPAPYKAFGGLIGGAVGGVAGYAVSSAVQFFEANAYSIVDSTFNKKS